MVGFDKEYLINAILPENIRRVVDSFDMGQYDSIRAKLPLTFELDIPEEFFV